jgi:hypothetical protein
MDGFDVERYFGVLNDQRERLGLSWSALTRELNAPFAHRPNIPPISTSTLTGMRSRSELNGNIVVHTMMWLRVCPEDFAPDHQVEGVPLPELRRGCLPRWDSEALFEALDSERRSKSLPWAALAEQIRGSSPAVLKSLRRGVGFPLVMPVLAWLGRPAADFVVNVPV